MRASHWFSLAVLLMAGTAAAQDMVVKIGHVGPLSGALAHLGQDSENGARMAIDELNAKGVTIGGKRARLELVAEDDAADPKQATAAAQKLCDAKASGVVGHLNSGTSIPASAVYNQCGMPMVTPSATDPTLTQQGFQNVFRLQASDSAQGAGLALYAAETLKLRRVAIIDDRTTYGQGIAEAFKRSAKSRGLQIVDEQSISDKATDVSGILSSIKSRSAEAVFYGGVAAQAGLILRQLDQQGMGSVKLLGGDGICTDSLSRLAGAARSVEGVVCVEGGLALDQMPGGKAWKARYERAYPGKPSLFAPFSYDAVHVLVDAMQRAGTADPRAYLAKLRDANLQGVTGRIRFSSSGDLSSPALMIYRFRPNGSASGFVRTSTTGTPTCAGNQCYCEKAKECRDKCDAGC